MRVIDIVRLVILAAIWGSSFLFMRILAPVLGPVVTADARVLIAGIVLVGLFAFRGPALEWKRHWRQYTIIGVVNTAVPFLLFSYAALHIPASYSAILNATSPLFGMVVTLFWLSERPTLFGVLGAFLGMTGVAMITGLGSIAVTSEVVLSIAACLAAALCYAIAGVYMKRQGSRLNPVAIAGAAQLVAGLTLLPPSIAMPPPGEITGVIIGCTLALALLCSAIAYLLYYRLIADCGPTRALTVTFLIPVFGVLWGVLFLSERASAGVLVGCALVIAGAALVLRRPRP